MLEAVGWTQALWSALLATALAGLTGVYLLHSQHGPLRLIGIARASAVLLLISLVAYLRAATISMTEGAGDGLLDAMWLVLTQTHIGAMLQLCGLATLVELLLLFLPGLSPSGVIWRVLSGLTIISLAVGRAGAGHAIDQGMISTAVLVDTIHVLAACTWFGVAMVCCAATYQWKTWSHAEQLALTRRVSRIATIALLAVGITGIFNALRMIDIDNVSLQTPYTKLLAFKLCGVGLAVILGAYNRWVSMPRMQLYPGSAGRRFAQILVVETVVLGLVMIAASSLGTVMPPM